MEIDRKLFGIERLVTQGFVYFSIDLSYYTFLHTDVSISKHWFLKTSVLVLYL